MPQSPLDVDPDDYLSAAAVFLATNDQVCDLVSAAATAAGAGGGMAGTDTGGVAWAGSYDRAAATGLRAGAALAGALGHLGELLGRSAANHAGAEAAAVPGGPPAYPGEGTTPAAAGVIPAVPPSANGTGDDPPTGWSFVAHLLEYTWPNGHQDQLRAVARGWTDAADGLDEVASRLDSAIGDVTAVRSPEVDAAVTTCRTVQQCARDLSDACATLGASCSDYATQLDHAHSQVEQELVEVVAEAALVELFSAVLAAPTAGGSEVAGQAAVGARLAEAAVRIGEILAELVSLSTAGAALLGVVTTRATSLATQLDAVWAKRGADSVARVATAVAARIPPVDLVAQESNGGHTIDRHVGKSDAYLVGRRTKFASTFPDLATAEAATALNLSVNRDKVEQWLHDTTRPTKDFSMPVSPAVGKIYVSKTGQFIEPTRVSTVLERVGNSYIVLTSFPDID